VRRLLSETAHGRVYLAEEADGTLLAVKELVFAHAPDMAQVEAFEREGQLLAQLSHPRIPRYRAAFTEGEGAQARFYLAQDYIPGESLQARLEHHRFNEAEARDIAWQVLQLLDCLHSQTPPVLHRDVKPANLLRRNDGDIVLVDFGAARALVSGQSHESTVTGTFGYMAPEQLGGSVSPASDLYGLGASLLHLLSRKPPETLLRGDWELEFQREVHVSKPFAAFLRKLVARRPEERYPSAASALAALEAPAVAPRPRWPWAAAGAVLLGLGAAVLVRPGEAPPPTVATPARAPAQAPAAPAMQPPPNGTLGRWKLDERWSAEQAKDERRLHPLRRMDVTDGPGVFERSVLLSGRGRLVLEPSVGPPTLQRLHAGAFSFWLSREGAGEGPVLTTYADTEAGPERVLQVRVDADGKVGFGLRGRWLHAPRGLESGRFSHVAVEWGPGGTRLLVDGLEVAKDATPVPPEGVGARFTLGWDETAPEQRVPPLAVDELRLDGGPFPEQLQDEVRTTPMGQRASPSVLLALQGAPRVWPPVPLRLPTARALTLTLDRKPPHPDCRARAQVKVERVTFHTQIPQPPFRELRDIGPHVVLTTTLRYRDPHAEPRCRLGALRFSFQDEEGREHEGTELRLEQARGAGKTAKATVTLPPGKMRGVLTFGEPLAPLARFRLDAEQRTVERLGAP
jgi:serine/threonine-protein kinase